MHRDDTAHAAREVPHDQRPAPALPDGGEREMDLLPVTPRCIQRRGGDRLARRWRPPTRIANEPGDERRLEAQLFGIGDVLPGTAAAGPEMRTSGHDPVRRRLKDLDERRGHRRAMATIRDHADAFAGNGVGNRQRPAAVNRNAVAPRVQPLYGDVDGRLRVANLRVLRVLRVLRGFPHRRGCAGLSAVPTYINL